MQRMREKQKRSSTTHANSERYILPDYQVAGSTLHARDKCGKVVMLHGCDRRAGDRRRCRGYGFDVRLLHAIRGFLLEDVRAPFGE